MVKHPDNIVVGISIGDMNGIGPEVVLKTFEDNRMLESCTPVIFANVKIISFLKKSYNLQANIQGIEKLDQIIPGKINVLNVWREGVNLEIGKLDDTIGKYAIQSFEAATKALQEDKIDVLVTAPINKYNIQSENYKHAGHTDYLNEKLQGDALMFMVHEDLKVGLVTDHVAIQDLHKHINKDLITKKIKTIHHSLMQDFGIHKPKIAVLGLNPHSGDNGVIGKEEDELVKPTLQELFKNNIAVFGPFAADSFFGSNNYKNYDAVIAMYHDQGLIPFKTLSFGEGVNFTAGLDKIRTSPDHGTAYDIAGKNIANETSFRNAVYSALDILNNRKSYTKLTKNPLKKISHKEDNKKE
jgi:4-hydroxythreonine-4-phosphate dehydrogenase